MSECVWRHCAVLCHDGQAWAPQGGVSVRSPEELSVGMLTRMQTLSVCSLLAAKQMPCTKTTAEN